MPTDAAVDPSSAQMVASLNTDVRSEEQAKNGPWFDTVIDGVPIVKVPKNAPTVQVALDPGHANPRLGAAWHAVPLPPDAQPSSGEHDLAVWQPSTDSMWEFFQLRRTDGSWYAEWGGAMRHVSTNPGVYRTGAWPGAQPNWGVTAASLPLVGGAVTLAQAQAGTINHALALAVPHTRAGVLATPAERTDGNTASAQAIPEGAHLRLDPELNIAKLHLAPFARMLADAAQRYGIIVRDTGGVVSFFGQPAPAGSDTYSRLANSLATWQLLSQFPWDHLEVLRMKVRRVSG